MTFLNNGAFLGGSHFANKAVEVEKKNELMGKYWFVSTHKLAEMEGCWVK
jgi:hypothetical protein